MDMEEKQKTGKIALIVLLSFLGLNFVFLNILFFRNMFSDFLNQLFLMFLYAVIPCVFAVILRAVFGVRALKWIALSATVLGGLCCIIHIFLPKTMLDYNEWIFVLTQCVLTSSIPALYCVAFAGDLYCFPFVRKGRSIFVALAPSLMFFLSLFIRQVIVKDLSETMEFIFDESILLPMLSSVVYAVWALLLIFISFMINMAFNHPKIKNSEKINKNIKLIAVVILVLYVPLITVLIIYSLPLLVPEPVFEISFNSDELHSEYNFEITQGSNYHLVINSKSGDVFVTVYIFADGEVIPIYKITGNEITEDLTLFLEKGIYTVTVELIPVEWGDEIGITTAKFNMTLTPLFVSNNKK
jgi:hypothetical protein